MPTRPPFTGIHETYPIRAAGGPHEGGGRLPPFGEDIFQRVVDINFPGGGNGAIFASGDYCCFVRSGTVPFPPEEQSWRGVGAPVFTGGGAALGGACAVINGRPTFLLSGSNRNGGCVALSHDGYTWEQTFGLGSYFPTMWAMIWDPDEQLFYGFTRRYAGDVGFERLYISPDGYTWILTENPISDFWEHTQNPYGEPDGVVGYNPDTDKWIHPEDLQGMDVPGITLYPEGTTFLSVAFAGGVWCATGYGVIDHWEGGEYAWHANFFITSFDDGVTWSMPAHGDLDGGGDYGVPALIGLPLDSFSEGT